MLLVHANNVSYMVQHCRLERLCCVYLPALFHATSNIVLHVDIKTGELFETFSSSRLITAHKAYHTQGTRVSLELPNQLVVGNQLHMTLESLLYGMLQCTHDNSPSQLLSTLQSNNRAALQGTFLHNPPQGATTPSCHYIEAACICVTCKAHVAAGAGCSVPAAPEVPSHQPSAKSRLPIKWCSHTAAALPYKRLPDLVAVSNCCKLNIAPESEFRAAT